MRRRYQEGSLKKVDGKWIAQWWEDGHRRKRTLGLVSMVPKAQARSELDNPRSNQQPGRCPVPFQEVGRFREGRLPPLLSKEVEAFDCDDK
jgi:hypothetical protein